MLARGGEAVRVRAWVLGGAVLLGLYWAWVVGLWAFMRGQLIPWDLVLVSGVGGTAGSLVALAWYDSRHPGAH
jgi:hypothetical protein